MEAYVAQTIDWVLASDYPNFEVIIVDDGSGDSSACIAAKYLDSHNHILLMTIPNQGVSTARNTGIQRAKGKYILPVDADDMITPSYISEAVNVLETQPNVKVVTAEAEFFGDKTGLWKLPPFDLSLLARKNHIAAIALYRKEDWAKAGGYATAMMGREDWDFWISMLKDGGEVVRLPIIGFKYRIRSNSKRIRTRKLKSVINAQLNERHPEFFQRMLGGPLRIQRTWSKPYNLFLKALGLLK